METARLHAIRALAAEADRHYKSLRTEEKTWRYFCGICWNKLREQEGQA